MDRSASYDFPSVGLSRTVSEIDGDFGQKSQMFLTLRQFNEPSEGLEFGKGGSVQKVGSCPY